MLRCYQLMLFNVELMSFILRDATCHIMFQMMWRILTANLFMATKKSSELDGFTNAGFLSGLIDDNSLREQSLVFMMNLHG